MKEGVRGRTLGSPTYIELHCHSAYSFFDGASHPEELVTRAAELGYPSLALTDHAGIRPITGAEVTVSGVGSTEPLESGGGGFAAAGAEYRAGRHITLLCESGKGYANLCRILTAAHAGTRRPGR